MTSGFEHVWDAVDDIPGWLTMDQGRALWDAAGSVDPGATIVEIGSHHGRSTLVLGRQAADRGATVIAIDPFVEGRMFGGSATRGKFEANVAAAGLSDTVELVIGRSTELRPGWTRPIQMLYVDGKHDYWTASDDLRWAEHLPSGAPLLVHDAFSSIGVTAALARYIVRDHGLRYVGRVGSLVRFEVGPAPLRDRLRMIAQLPWFVRNVAIKVVLRALRVVGFRRSDPF